MRETHRAKGADYNGQARDYDNLREGQDWNVKPWVMAMMRAGEKMRRVKTFARTGSLQNEGLHDSLLDIAVLSLIAHILHEEDSVAIHPHEPAGGSHITEARRLELSLLPRILHWRNRLVKAKRAAARKRHA